MTCSNCGEKLSAGAQFCAACGTVSGSAPVDAPATTPATEPATNSQPQAPDGNKLRFWGRNRSIGGWAMSLTIISLLTPTALIGIAAVVLSVIALRKKEQYALYTMIASTLILLWHQFGFFVLSWFI